MTRRQWSTVFAALIVLVPGVTAAGWWYYWPTYVLAQAEKAAAANDLARAEELLKQATRQAPDTLRAQLLYVQVLRRLKRPAEAQNVLWQAIQRGLPESDGRREFALAEAVKGFSPNAEENLKQVLDERPDDTEVLQALAEGYAQSQRWEEADRCYTRWLELQPDRPEVWFARGRARLAAVGVSRGRADAAADDFREVLRRDPTDFDARLYLAHCLLSDARMAEAKEELLVCNTMRPERPEPLVGLAACATEDRQWDRAETLLRHALAREPKSAYILGMLGDLELRRQEFDRASAFFRQVLELEPRNKGAHLKLAQAFRSSGKPEQAREEERIFQELENDRQRAQMRGLR